MVLKNEIPSRLCVGAYDLLSKTYKSAGFLPNNKKPDDYLNSTTQELFEGLETVCLDDNYWSRFPNITRPSQEQKERAQKTMTDLMDLTMQRKIGSFGSINGATPEEVLESFEKMAETPEEIRQQFYDLLEKVSL